MFTPLTNLEILQKRYLEYCTTRGILGTILLAPEGINGYLAGEVYAIQDMKSLLLSEQAFSALNFKESYSETIPYRKLLVKIKDSIISFDSDDIHPNELTGTYVSPQTLKEWLDNNMEIVLLDTRNTYETEMGAFKNARTLPIAHFRDFPKLFDEIKNEFDQKTIVMYCTGGIRCEKATAYALKSGLKNVYQLHGGILQYLKDCGGAHYEGTCFVFDNRRAVNVDLEETN